MKKSASPCEQIRWRPRRIRESGGIYRETFFEEESGAVNGFAKLFLETRPKRWFASAIFLTAGNFLPKLLRTHNRIDDQTASSRPKYCDGKKLGFLPLSHGFWAIAWLIRDRLFPPTLNGFGPIHMLVAGLQDLLKHRPDILGS